MKTLETNRLILRDWRVADIGCEVFVESTIRYLITAKNNYAVVLKDEDMVIGTIGLNEDADEKPNRRNVGFRLLGPYQNKGLMSEALECIINNASDVTAELSYLCRCDDKRSQHIAEKFGFQYAKTFYHVRKKPSDKPENYFYYILPLKAIAEKGCPHI